MTDKATQIVEWLYSNDPTLIERAFAAYTPNLEHVVKLSLQSRSSDLQEIDFANLPLNQVLLDQFFITEYLSKVIEVQIGDELQEVYLIQSQVAEVEIAPSSMDELRGLLSCLKGNCWSNECLSEKFGSEGRYDDIVAVYFDSDAKTIHSLDTSGNLRGKLNHDEVIAFSMDFEQSTKKMSLAIDDQETNDEAVYIPVLYFICMKAGVSYSKITPCRLPFNPSDPIEIQYAENGIPWTIVDSEVELDLTPYFM